VNARRPSPVRSPLGRLQILLPSPANHGPWLALLLLVLAWGRHADARTSGDLVSQGNALFSQGQYNQAVSQYDQALTEDAKLDQARFNKADALYRMDDLAKAIEGYNEVSAQSKDMDLVRKAKYNLGNAHFQRGLKQKDSDLEKALDDLKTSIGYWRAVLDLDPANENAKRNKEVAGLLIKDILDQIKKKQEQQKQSDPNQGQESGSQKPEAGKEQQQNKDPNQAKEPNQPQDPNQSQQQKQQQSQQDPNQPSGPNHPQPKTEQVASDMTAQQILDKEQQQKDQRQMQVRARRMPVDKDW
jgi:Ca-activated chloride channel homolog